MTETVSRETVVDEEAEHYMKILVAHLERGSKRIRYHTVQDASDEDDGEQGHDGVNVLDGPKQTGAEHTEGGDRHEVTPQKIFKPVHPIKKPKAKRRKLGILSPIKEAD